MMVRLVVMGVLTLNAGYAAALNVNLGTADSFAVLAGSTVTNTGATLINGNVGVWPGAAITGLLPVMVTGTIDVDNAIAMQAQSDLTTAYNFAAGEACGAGNDLTGQDLGGLILTPGVYCFSSSAQLTGTLTLNALGDLGAVFVFQIGSTLTTATGSSVVFINGGQGDKNVYWQVGSSATLGTGTAFEGNILALTSITLTTGATISCGSALASNGAVTMDTNVVGFAACESSTVASPEPTSNALLSIGLLFGLVFYCKTRLRSVVIPSRYSSYDQLAAHRSIPERGLR